MLRGRWYAIVLMMIGAVSLVAAEDTADIMVGGEVVARVREAGTHETVEHRAIAADEAIEEILAATDDPTSLEVSLEQVDGMWTIMLNGKSVLSVYPAEAEANGMTPEMLGSIWARQFRNALPDATTVEVTEIDEPEEPAEPATPRETMVIMEEPVTGSPTPTVERPTPTETEAEEPEETLAQRPPGPDVLEIPTTPRGETDEIVVGQGARLMILEAFNRARDLSEDDYLVRREEMADDLFDELVQVITEGSARGRIAVEPTPDIPTPPTPTDPEEPEEAEIEIPAAPVETVTVGEPVPAISPEEYELSDEGRQSIVDRIPADDPSYAGVVEKVSIRAKFQAASEAYREALTSDPSAAAQARELLSAARRERAADNFETAEQYLNTALQVLGVTEWEHNIPAAMRDYGIE